MDRSNVEWEGHKELQFRLRIEDEDPGGSGFSREQENIFVHLSGFCRIIVGVVVGCLGNGECVP